MLKKLNKNLYKIILATMCIHVVALRWLNLHNYGGYILDILLLLHIALNIKEYDKKSLILVFAFYLYFVINFLVCGGTLYNFLYNIRGVLTYTLLIPFVIWLINNKFEFIKNNFKKAFVPINIYLFLNIVAIYFESLGYYKVAGMNYRKDFTFSIFADSVSGLLGVYCQPTLALFFALVILYNFVYANKYLDNKKKKYLYVYNCAIIIYSLYVSSVYGNNLYYAVLPCVLFVYVLILIGNKYAIDKALIIKMCLALLIVIGLGIACYCFIPFVKNAINYMIGATTAGFDYKVSGGSSERIAMILYYLNELNIIMGYGLGNGYLIEVGLFGYRHFGISEFGTILCLGGLILMVIYLLMYFNLYKKLFKSNLLTIIMLGISIVFGLATQIIYGLSSGILFLFIIIVLRFVYQND